MAPLLDTFRRPLRNLRLSVTDRCNLRCAYCMPEEEYAWLPRGDVLTFEEIVRLVDVFTGLGVERVRLTGGEPLARRDLPELLRLLARRPALRDIALTTNGTLLAEQAGALRAAGLHRVTVSLDTLDPERFRRLTRRASHGQVLEGIAAARAAGFAALKLDTVVLRGTNDDELVPLLEYARSIGAELRYIEYMDVGGATRWSPEQVVSRREILDRLAARYGPIDAVHDDSSAPADLFRLPDGLVFGIISSTTQPFCATCDRSRLTADGHWFLCLYARDGLDLRALLRGGADDAAIRDAIAAAWRARTDRGAEDRLALHQRGPMASLADLRADPRLEMHTRGG
ncbi:MAG: GTP 3',8-cyclase MoaA [Planctomycetes bacterium]|nr:GTP 3',8-cyclase MoaA [Planctomycetota bacterium]